MTRRPGAQPHPASRHESSTSGDAPVIRPMRPDDLEAIMELEPVLFGSGSWSRATYGAELAHPGRRYVVVDHDDQLAGYAGIDLAPEATVMTIGVAPQFRRQGLGRAMLEHLLDLARGSGSVVVHLEVRADDAGAQALYSRSGFTPVGRRRGYYQGTDALLMRLRLRGPGPVGSERNDT